MLLFGDSCLALWSPRWGSDETLLGAVVRSDPHSLACGWSRGRSSCPALSFVEMSKNNVYDHSPPFADSRREFLVISIVNSPVDFTIDQCKAIVLVLFILCVALRLSNVFLCVCVRACICFVFV